MCQLLLKVMGGGGEKMRFGRWATYEASAYGGRDNVSGANIRRSSLAGVLVLKPFRALEKYMRAKQQRTSDG